jgi:hypothetical protein
VEAAWQTVTFVVPPPPTVGTHYVVVLYALEDHVDFVFSSTNWTLRRPIWFDGNDVVDLPPSMFERLRATRMLQVPGYLNAFYPGRLPETRIGGRIVGSDQPQGVRSTMTHHFAGTAIRIDVVDEL